MKKIIIMLLLATFTFTVNAQLVMPRNATFVEYKKDVLIDTANTFVLIIDAPQHQSTLQKVLISIDTINTESSKIYAELKGRIFDTDNWISIKKDSTDISTAKTYNMTFGELSTANLYRYYQIEVKGNANDSKLKLTRILFKQWLQ